VWTRFVAGMSLLDWYGETLIVALPLCFVYAGVKGLLRSTRSAAAATSSAENDDQGSLRFLTRLPPRLGRDLLCLQMEDHYVRAHTAAGSDLILIPLHQAVAELQGLEGLQVHRSWWVSRSAVLEVERDGRSVRLKLRNGVSAPVSRRAVAALKAAAWID
jgi:DNA-binding LytR/AlgR family response regulator